MKKLQHSDIQSYLDRMKLNNDELTFLLHRFASELGKLINYKHKEKKEYRILLTINGKEYDMDDLLEQVVEYIKRGKNERKRF